VIKHDYPFQLSNVMKAYFSLLTKKEEDVTRVILLWTFQSILFIYCPCLLLFLLISWRCSIVFSIAIKPVVMYLFSQLLSNMLYCTELYCVIWFACRIPYFIPPCLAILWMRYCRCKLIDTQIVNCRGYRQHCQRKCFDWTVHVLKEFLGTANLIQ